MTTRFFFAILIPVLSLSACGEKAPSSMQPLDITEAKAVSDAVADDLIRKDAKDLFKRMDVGFQTMVRDDKDLSGTLEKMYSEPGVPLEFELKASSPGTRKDGVWTRPSRTFWYAAKTKKYPKGKYFLKVEIVPAFSGHPLDTSGFGILSFKEKVPDALK